MARVPGLWRPPAESGRRGPDAVHLLDLGVGIAGAARYFARERGRRMTGIDLTEEHGRVATASTRRVGLDGPVSFHRGGARALPSPAGGFGGACMPHAGMDVAGEAALFAGGRRVPGPGRCAPSSTRCASCAEGLPALGTHILVGEDCARKKDNIPVQADAAQNDDIPVQVVAEPRRADILARQGRAVADVIRPVGIAGMMCATSRRHRRWRPAGRPARPC